MNPTEAREYLKVACKTEVGRDILRSLGLEAVIAEPDRGDDESTVAVATAVWEEMQRRYRL